MRLSREIHDTLGQNLSAVWMHLQGLAGSGLAPQTQKRLDAIGSLVHSSIEQARDFVRDLRAEKAPTPDVVMELTTAARILSAGTATRVRVEVVATEGPAVGSLSATLSRDLLRIGQEAIGNAVRHAQARDVLVDLRFDRRHVALRIKDDGAGFVVSEAKSADTFGLRTMRERAESHGGTFHVRSEKGQGTEISVTIPLVFGKGSKWKT
jgi:signal transduction histidine kinase